MKLKKSWKRIFVALSALSGMALFAFLLISLVPEPPAGEIKYARELLSEAEKINAGAYSEGLFSEAKILYDSAMYYWQKENKRFIYFRNFDRVSLLAESAAEKAEAAMRKSKTTSSNLQMKLKHQIDTLNKLVSTLDRYFSSYPLPEEIRHNISRGRLLLRESEISFRKGDFIQAGRKSEESGNLLVSSYEKANLDLTNYFDAFPEWKKWAEKTIRESRQNAAYAIIVDKFARKCRVYKNGVQKHEFDVELGRNWVGHKREKGDDATPEGLYKITKKLDGSRTKYHKALLINYPNEADLEEFRKSKEKGLLPSSARLGSLIEIHGGGGRGADWTEGCVALTDTDMDTLYKIIQIGTPVTIVGSLVTLEEALRLADIGQ